MRSRLQPPWDRYREAGGLPTAFDGSDIADSEAVWAAAQAVSPSRTEIAVDSAVALGEVKRDPATTLTEIGYGRSHTWARQLDHRAQEGLVWFRIRQPGKPQGSSRRILVDPAYGENFESYIQALLRSIWRSTFDDKVDMVQDHGVEWKRQGAHDFFLTGKWVIEAVPVPVHDQRKLRPLRAMVRRGHRALVVTQEKANLSTEPPAIPVWVAALAFELGVAAP